jgi:hypothetical protein
MTDRFDPATRVTLRRGLMRRGQELASKLSALLAGADGERLLRALGLDAKPGARPEEILRAALEQVEQRRLELDAHDEPLGRSEVCGVEHGAASQHERPWADRCQAHPPGAARP